MRGMPPPPSPYKQFQTTKEMQNTNPYQQPGIILVSPVLMTTLTYLLTEGVGPFTTACIWPHFPPLIQVRPGLPPQKKIGTHGAGFYGLVVLPVNQPAVLEHQKVVNGM